MSLSPLPIEVNNIENQNIQHENDKRGINNLLNDHNVDELCLYIEQKLKKFVKRGDLYNDRELVTKTLFHYLLSEIPNYYIETEVPIKVNHKTRYADLLMVEVNPADNARRNRFIFEFKHRGVNFLDLQIKGRNRNWEVMEARAKKVEAMTEEEIRQLKLGNVEKFYPKITIESILKDAGKQLLDYVRNLENDYHTSAFVVMTVGSRKLIWEKINLDSI